MVPAPHLIDRFCGDLDSLIPVDKRLGIAVSGGPDSLALLLLAATARRGKVESATVDHGLRPGAADEAEIVRKFCEKLGVPHVTLTAKWARQPTTAIQEQARDERYGLLGAWAKKRGLDAIVTAHHADDQAETFLMRLARGSGLRGLAGMRRIATLPGDDMPLLRPLLGWRREELEQVCAGVGVDPVNDPSNLDEQFERVRVRNLLASTSALDSASIAASANWLGEADRALEWATDREWQSAVSDEGSEFSYRPYAPAEIQRRIVARIIALLGSEGNVVNVRGKEMERVVAALGAGEPTTIRGVRCQGGAEWHFSAAPPRRR